MRRKPIPPRGKKTTKTAPRRATPSPLLEGSEEHTIPKALPVRVLSDHLVARIEHEERAVREYVEVQARPEKVTHLEKVKTERLRTRAMDAWDVRTNRGRYWVITNPTNLYLQRHIPSLDFAISVHVGVTERVFSRQTPPVPSEEQQRLATAWRRWEQAVTALDHADEAEEFQAVGLRCRECLLDLVAATAKDDMVPPGEEAPKRGDFVHWSALLASTIAHGSSAERVRQYLKTVAEETWQLVNWVAHARNATQSDGRLAVDATQNVLAAFTVAVLKHESGAPERCPRCSSYQLTSDYRSDIDIEVTLCEACGWTDAPTRNGERDTIRRIREAVRSGALGQQFTPADVNRTLKIDWAGTFLPKHRRGNPGRHTVLFIRVERGVYRLA